MPKNWKISQSAKNTKSPRKVGLCRKTVSDEDVWFCWV